MSSEEQEVFTKQRGRGVAVAIPCLDEESTIAAVVRGMREVLPEARVVVFDNASTDATSLRALEAGAEVIAIAQRGKGVVVRTALRRLLAEGAEVVLLVDGDATYDPRAAPRLIAEVRAGVDLAFAARTGSGDGRYRPGHELGNRFLKLLHRLTFGATPPDPLTGYRALSRSFAAAFPARSRGFAIETEMNLFVLAGGHSWSSIDAPYFPRPQGSQSKLSTVRDGVRILAAALGGTLLALERDPAPGDRLARPSAASVVSTGAYAACTLLLCVACFLLANLWWVHADSTPLERVLRHALADSSAPSVEGLSRASPVDASLRDSPEAFNDCLIPIMALEKQGTPLELAISARRVYRFSRPQRPCDALEQRLHRGGIDPNDYLTVFYHSYWNGQRVLLRALAPSLGVGGLRTFLRVATWALIGLGSLLALVLAVRGPPSAAPLRWSTAAMLLAFALSGDLPRRAASFTSAPSNLLCLIFLLVFGLHARGLLALARRSRVVVLTAFGALLGYLALFFGTVLIGFVFVLLLVACTPLAGRELSSATAVSQTTSARRALESARTRLLLESTLAFLIGVVGSLVMHAVLAAVVFDGAFAAIVDQLHHRMTGDPRTTMHPALNERYGGEHVSWRQLFARLDGRVHQIAFGSQIAGRLVALASVLGGLALCLHQIVIGSRSRPGAMAPSVALDRVGWLSLLLAGLAVPAWYVLFREHTITHAGNMVRLLFLSLGIALAALGGRVLLQRE